MRAVSRGALASVCWHCSMQSGCTAVHEGKQCLFPCDVTIKSTFLFIQINSCNLPYTFCEQIGKEIKDISDEIPFEIPDSWEWVRFSTIIELQSGQDLTPDKYNADGKGVPYITGASNIENNNVIINRWTEYGRAFAYNGDILLTCKGTIGTIAILQQDQVHIARQIMGIHPCKNIETNYVKIVLETLVETLKAAAKSMIPGITRDNVLSSLIPIPPLSEQRKIVLKIEQLLPFIEKYEQAETQLTALNTSFPEMLKKSILQEAVQGKLVPQNPDDEPASVLLERIRAEKQKLIKAGKIKKSKHESVIITRDKIPYEILDGKERCIADEVPFELPESWEWAYIGNIAFVTKLAGFEYTKNIAPNLQSSGIPLFKGKNVQNGRLVYNFEGYIPEPLSNELIRSQINKKCLLTPYVGSIGNIAIFPGDFKAHLGSNVGKIEIIQNLVIEEYVMYFFRSYAGYNELTKYKKATAQESISIEAIRNAFIPIPPLAEQKRIVEKIEELIPMINSMSK